MKAMRSSRRGSSVFIPLKHRFIFLFKDFLCDYSDSCSLDFPAWSSLIIELFIFGNIPVDAAFIVFNILHVKY
jgi:hypothetical protein